MRTSVEFESDLDALYAEKEDEENQAGAIAGGVVGFLLIAFWIFCCICVSTKGFKKKCKVKRCRKCCCECKCKCC